MLFAFSGSMDPHVVDARGSFIYFNELISNPANDNERLDMHVNEMSSKDSKGRGHL